MTVQEIQRYVDFFLQEGNIEHCITELCGEIVHRTELEGEEPEDWFKIKFKTPLAKFGMDAAFNNFQIFAHRAGITEDLTYEFYVSYWQKDHCLLILKHHNF